MTDDTGGASAKAIQHHYDVGNEFYRLWLDRTLTYSGAMWRDAHDLEEAQIRKLDYHAQQAGAVGAKLVLDIGCGWGSLLSRLVAHHRVDNVVGLTLSDEQRHCITARREPGVTVRVESWANHVAVEPYDSIISIGALEHFARIDLSIEEKIARYRKFFEFCHHNLRPGGRMSLQAIAYGNLLREDIRDGFVAREIFPESDFVRLAELVEASEFLFEIEQLRNDPEDYELTCREWLERLRKNQSQAELVAGVAIVAKWLQYLELSIRGWNLRATNLLRITMKRIDRPRLKKT